MAKKKGRPVVDTQGSADFRRLPDVPTAQELIDTAFHRASKASAAQGAPGMAGRNRELARIGTAAKTLESRLNKIVRSFPSLDRLHPFYFDLVDVLVGVDPLKKSLGSVHWAHGQVQRVRQRAEGQVRGTKSNYEAMKARKAAYGRMASFVEQVASDLAFLGEARTKLRHIPTLKLDAPVLVIAGYPNVGKSSFLDKVSRATPEVAPYPFTTKGIIVGHVGQGRREVQLMDTPGVLDRPIEERNSIERQAIHALRHAADAVLFVLDPSGHCGYPLEDQSRLLDEVRRDFGQAPLVVTENKADLETTGEPGHLTMSCESGDGVDDVLAAALKAAWKGFEERMDRSGGGLPARERKWHPGQA